MANITLAIPNDLHGKMRKHSEIRWSELVRAILEKRIMQLELMERLASKSKLTQEDAEEIADKIKRGIARRHGIK